MSYDVQALQVHFQGVLPYLSKNLDLANTEYMNAEIPHGAFNCVLARHGEATILANISDLPRQELADDQTLFQAGAPILNDLKCVLKDLSGSEQAEATQKYEALLAFYQASGFTEKHIFGGYPVLPKVTPELLPENA